MANDRDIKSHNGGAMKQNRLNLALGGIVMQGEHPAS
jgi:hypothetical protein